MDKITLPKIGIVKNLLKMEKMSVPVKETTPTPEGLKIVESSEGQWINANGIKHVALIKKWDDTKKVETGDILSSTGETITLIHGGVYGTVGKKKYKIKRKAEKETTGKNGVYATKEYVRQDAYFQDEEESDTDDVSGAKAGEAFISSLAAATDRALSW